MLPKGLLKEHWRSLSLAIRCMDMMTVFAAGAMAYFLKFEKMPLEPAYVTPIIIGMVFTPAIFSFFNMYASVRGNGFVSHFINLLQAICVLAILLAGLAFFTKSGEAYSRLWFAIWMGITFGAVILLRCILLLFLRFMRSQGLNERRVVIFGAGVLGSKLALTVQQAVWTGFRIVKFIDDNATSKSAFIRHIPVVQTPENLSHYLTAEGIDEIWLALPLRAELRMKEILHELRHHTINTRFVLDIFGLDLLNHSITDVAGFPVLNIRSTPMTGINRMVKAIEDRILAAMILVLISPLLLLIAMGVKYTSRGPIFSSKID